MKGIPNYVSETCCLQMSYALNNSGVPIKAYEFRNPVAGRKVRAFQSGGRNYLFEVSDMRFYLDNRYGQAENYQGSKQTMTSPD